MHADDARRRGLSTGDLVEVASASGRIDVPVEVTDAIKPGVVSMPHGWGHGLPGTRMTVANGSPGVNTNALSPPTFIDEPSGNGALNGIPVSVTAIRTAAQPPGWIGSPTSSAGHRTRE
jgi:anaerobic selenocysteine-containing dehydrogenase